MREILFRGRRIDNGQWIEGAFLNDRDGAFYICPVVSDITYGDNGNRRRIGCWYKVDPATVGQYTGLADNNGKRIFEGDVTLANNGHLSKVVFWCGSFCLYCECHKTHSYFIPADILEVIGNIHNNPKLLEVE